MFITKNKAKGGIAFVKPKSIAKDAGKRGVCVFFET
jgi:hypothetical protein